MIEVRYISINNIEDFLYVIQLAERCVFVRCSHIFVFNAVTVREHVLFSPKAF